MDAGAAPEPTGLPSVPVVGGSRHEYIRNELLRRVPPPASVVELGAAPGDQIAGLAQLGYTATAVDIGIASDQWATGEPGRMQRLLEAWGVRLVEWNLEETPYPLDDRAFDAVVHTEVFEHLRDYPVHSVEEAFRILRPGGLLVFTTPNAAYLRNRVNALLGRSVASPLHDWVGGPPHARRAREYTVAEVVEVITSAGFRPEVITSRHFHVDFGSTSTLARVSKRAVDRVAQLRPTFGPCTVVLARRPPE